LKTSVALSSASFNGIPSQKLSPSSSISKNTPTTAKVLAPTLEVASTATV